MPIRVVVGLGNPGPRYRGTRHNVGFMLADRLAPAGWKAWRGLGEWSPADLDGTAAWLVKPGTFMNDSGSMVRAFASFHKVQAAGVLVCYDDLALPLGRLRLRPGGSSGGHKGMESVIAHMGTGGVPRLRIGIGPLPPGRDAVEFVLGRLGAAEREAMAAALERAAKAAAAAVARGVEAAMNDFNAPEAAA